MKIKTRSEDGSPCCPVCESEVDESGQFCTPSCFQHFIVVVSNQPGMIEMEQYLDIENQPWHTE